MLTEFGGIALTNDVSGTWGYTVCRTPEDFASHFERLLEVVGNLGLLAGFCYTQFSDTYQEANGLLYADRTPKVPLRRIADAVNGKGMSFDSGLERIARGGDRRVDEPGSQ
jgi:hypothetical protein